MASKGLGNLCRLASSMTETVTKILRKYFFRDTGTGKYYVVGSYSEEEALELLGDIDIGIKNRAEVVPEEEVPQNNAP